ncbi:hypothetical protein [Halorhodospira halochloris]|uniref:hypothetical protein n=1 Tax=Halorhodospira halochloris TaxID=1052 RepID=UPI0013A556CD|nr:hypothetical protein [Halorhodospira halochloris]
MNPSLEASWRHPWRQDLHTGADGGAGEVFRGYPYPLFSNAGTSKTAAVSHASTPLRGVSTIKALLTLRRGFMIHGVLSAGWSTITAV